MKTRSLVIAFFLSISSCGYYFERIGHDEDGARLNAAGPKGFAEVRAAIFDPYCITCHAQYANYANVANESAGILAAVNSDRMPKSAGPLPGDLKIVLRNWLTAGAPEEAGAHRPAPSELTPDWPSLSLHVFSSRCQVCHNPSGQAKFLDLSSRTAIFTSRGRLFGEGAGVPLIDFDQPERSYLLNVIQDDEEPMPPLSSGLPRLNAQEIAVLTEWIRLGLP